MARLTFNLLDYNEFYNHALGLGTSTSAVTTLFWVSVILLQVIQYTLCMHCGYLGHLSGYSWSHGAGLATQVFTWLLRISTLGIDMRSLASSGSWSLGLGVPSRLFTYHAWKLVQQHAHTVFSASCCLTGACPYRGACTHSALGILSPSQQAGLLDPWQVTPLHKSGLQAFSANTVLACLPGSKARFHASLTAVRLELQHQNSLRRAAPGQAAALPPQTRHAQAEQGWPLISPGLTLYQRERGCHVY
jgi:hypothetical protein